MIENFAGKTATGLMWPTSRWKTAPASAWAAVLA